jgi:hypothetical protein
VIKKRNMSKNLFRDVVLGLFLGMAIVYMSDDIVDITHDAFDSVFNRPAVEMKKKIEIELQDKLKAIAITKAINLSNIGDTQWDYVCLIWGEEYSPNNGKKTATKNIANFNTKDFWIADENITDGQGLTFISFKNKILATARINEFINITRVNKNLQKDKKQWCFEASQGVLKRIDDKGNLSIFIE